MLYVTGDTHASFYPLYDRLDALPRTDCQGCIILGDVGFNYHGGDEDRWNKQLMNSLGIPLFCIQGNHEQRPAPTGLYEQQTRFGGQVWVEPAFPNLIFARDGEIHDLDGRSALVIGGAYSVDKYYRLMHGYPWWADEQPDQATRQRVEAALAARDWQVDLILSHTCPARYIPQEALLPGLDQSRVDRSTELWLDTIESRTRYGRWYCGHWHINKAVDRMQFLFHDLIPLA